SVPRPAWSPVAVFTHDVLDGRAAHRPIEHGSELLQGLPRGEPAHLGLLAGRRDPRDGSAPIADENRADIGTHASTLGQGKASSRSLAVAGPPITPCSRNAATASGLIPSSSRSTSAVCSPSIGDGVRTEPGVSERRTGAPTIFTLPARGCSISTSAPRAAT